MKESPLVFESELSNVCEIAPSTLGVNRFLENSYTLSVKLEIRVKNRRSFFHDMSEVERHFLWHFVVNCGKLLRLLDDRIAPQ